MPQASAVNWYRKLYNTHFLYYLNNAKKIIIDLQNAGLATTQDILNLGLTSAVHYVFIVGSSTADALNNTLDFYLVDNQ